MDAIDFAAKYLGQTITSVGGVGGECVDLANQWAAEKWHIPHQFRNAVDWATDVIPGHPWQANTPLNAPMPGSLVVWGQNKDIFTGANGHIALVLTANVARLITLDQNWGGRFCTLRIHPYTGVLGWLKP